MFPSSPDFAEDLEDWISLEIELTGGAPATPAPSPSPSAAAAPSASAHTGAGRQRDQEAMRIIVDLGCFPTGRHYPGIAHLLRVAASGLAEGFLGDHLIAHLPIVAIDTETTGRDPASDRIVEVACVRYERGEITARHSWRSWLVNPGRPIPKEAFDVHGISDDDVKNAPDFAGILPELLQALAGAVPLAYNAEFDRKQLMSELGRLAADAGVASARVPQKCRLDRSARLGARATKARERAARSAKSRRASASSFAQAHRATNDAEAALNVFIRFQEDSRLPKAYARRS